MSDIGLEVKIASNGEECVQLFKAWQPDLIWMDRRMPVMDGVEATRRIRQLPHGDKVKIVAVTASAFMEQQTELQAAGMDDYVRKPFRISEIYDGLARVLGVKFIYRKPKPAAKAAPTPLSPQKLAAIKAELRDELRMAIESLDREYINAVIARIAAVDSELGTSLSRLADEFDYPSVLEALEAVAGE
jgi:CheY-like chemotaxis protein